MKFNPCTVRRNGQGDSFQIGKTKPTFKHGKVKIFSIGADKPILNGETEPTFKWRKLKLL